MKKWRRVVRHPVTYALRAVVPSRYHRAVAKGLFRLSGKMARVRTWQRFWPADLGRPRWRRASWSLSHRVLGLSMQLDWDHWDHWACQHENCMAVPCLVCGGMSCDEEDNL